jgi:3-methyladenine DNA glycosylase AlkD
MAMRATCLPRGKPERRARRAAPSAPPTAAAARRHLRELADPEAARVAGWFFKTGPGEYGEGDRFLGIRAAPMRAAARRFAALPLGQIDRLLASPWHEDRSLALLVLGGRFQRAEPAERGEIVRFYLAHTDRINNWDLVDLSAPHLLGEWLLDRPRGVLTRLAGSRNLWERRIAVLATLAFIRRGQFDDTLRLARRLSEDPHDLMHKAVGWMLREVGKRDLAVLRGFLDAHGPRLPRTALRYAIERLRPAERRRYLNRERHPRGSKR